MTKPQQPEILVFGATGGTGSAIVQQALDRGCGVNLFVRDAQRAQHLFNGLCTRLNFVVGDASQGSDVRGALAADIDAVIVSLGIYQRSPGGNDLARATANIIAAMQATGRRRLICISSLGVGDSRNQGNFMARLIQKTALRHTLADKELQEQALRESGLDWTIIRPSRLLNDAGPPYICTWTGKQPATKLVWEISRAQVAKLALDCLDDPQTIHAAINVTGCATRPASGG